MLTYAIRNKVSGSGRVQIKDASDWEVQPNEGVVRFVIPQGFGFKTGDRIVAKNILNNDERMNLISARDAMRMGYIIYDAIYKVEDNTIKYKDGVRYFANDGKITVDGGDYVIENGTVTIPSKLWIEDGKLEIDGDTIIVDTDFVKGPDGNYAKPQDIQYEDKSYEWHDYEPSKWVPVTHVSVTLSDKSTIGIDGVTCATLIPYIYYQGEKQAVSVKIDDEGKYTYSISGGTVVCEIEDTPWKDGEDTIFVASPKLRIGDAVCNLEREIASTKRGEFLLVYLSEPGSIVDGDVVEISEGDSAETKASVRTKDGIDYIIFSGNKYVIGDETIDCIEYNKAEYEITYIDDDGRTFYIETGGERILFEFTDGPHGEVARKIVSTDATMLHDFYGDATYDVKRYRFASVGVNKYRVTDVGDSDGDGERYVIVKEPNKWRYLVDRIINANIAKCNLIGTGLDSDDEADVNEEVCDLIGLNWEGYLFQRDVDKFKYFGYSIPGGTDGESIQSEPKIWDDYEFHYIVNYLTLNIPLAVDANIEANKEDLVENHLVNDIIDASINPILDYEKDIYYPVRIAGNDNETGMPTEFEDVDTIELNIHMRTRNESTGEIEEDGTWNIFDKYPQGVQVPMDRSDLLGFFGFETSDIYYQKSKIAKSFIRITVYDDVDPAKQNLLYMGCVFMDEHGLYMKYMNNIDNFSRNGIMNIKYDKAGMNQIGYSKSANAESEPCDKNFKPTWDNGSRMDSRMVITNRSNTDTSSEGFYFYIFRELGTSTYERNLYMRVDFCNAATGIASPLCLLPANKAGDSYIGHSDNDELAKFKEGYPLRELYDNMYITLEAIYDYNRKRYVYAFPEWVYGDDNMVKLNLFEIKIKDES